MRFVTSLLERVRGNSTSVGLSWLEGCVLTGVVSGAHILITCALIRQIMQLGEDPSVLPEFCC